MTMRKHAMWLGSKLQDIQRFIEDLFDGDLHAKRVILWRMRRWGS